MGRRSPRDGHDLRVHRASGLHACSRRSPVIRLAGCGRGGEAMAPAQLRTPCAFATGPPRPEH
eukprot:3678924-Alexandrium_andersonii.AAC.1